MATSVSAAITSSVTGGIIGAAVNTVSSAVVGLGDTLNSSYTLNVSAGNRVTGFTSINDGTSTSFTVQADRFSVVNDSDGNAISPFIITGGVVYIDSAHITSLAASQISAGTISVALTLNAATITGGSITIGSGFSVTNTGVMSCTGANISGSLYSTNGTIGGWSIGATTLTGGGVAMDSSAGTIIISNSGRHAAMNADGTISVYNDGGDGGITLNSYSGEGQITVAGAGAVIISGGSLGCSVQLQNGSSTSTLGAGFLVLNSAELNYYAGTWTFETGGVTASSFNSASSRRWKTNIVPITNAMRKIQQLSGVTFDWITKDSMGDIGFIAEDVDGIFPSLVSKDKDNIPSGIEYGKITALLVEGIKEQQETIKTLEARIAALEKRKK